MPTISRFYGIIIRMFFNDPAPPHFHASYGEHELIVGIQPIPILEEHAPQRVNSMVLEWAALPQCRSTRANRATGINKEGRMFHTIYSATPHTATRLRLVYTDGSTAEIDFAPLIEWEACMHRWLTRRSLHRSASGQVAASLHGPAG